jgi:hypothetical protein
MYRGQTNGSIRFRYFTLIWSVPGNNNDDCWNRDEQLISAFTPLQLGEIAAIKVWLGQTSFPMSGIAYDFQRDSLVTY